MFGQETLTKNLVCELVLSRNLDKNAFTAETTLVIWCSMRKAITLLLTAVLLTATSGNFAHPVLTSGEASESPWVPKEPMPTAGAHFKAGVVNDKIYVINWNVTYEYDLYNWSTKKPMPTYRDHFALATYQNKIYCIGGRRTNSAPSGTNEVYNPASDSWERKTAMPTPRLSLDANVVNGKIYLIGGLVQNPMFPDVKGTYIHTNKNEVYDPETDTWTTKAPIPTTVSNYASAVVNGKIYIISENVTHIQEYLVPESLPTQIYDPETDTWSTGAAPPYAVADAGAVTVANITPQRIYVIGGFIMSREVSYNQVYNVENDSWSIGTPLPTARCRLTVVAVKDKIYAIGGLKGYLYHAVELDVNEQYDPLKDKTIPAAPAPSPTPTQGTPTPEPENEPFPTALVITSVITVIVIGTGLLVYFKKRGKKMGGHSMRKTFALLLVLVFLTASSVVVFLPVKANPYMYHESVSAPTYVKPPNIIIASPSENAFYSNDETITLCFNVTGPDAPNLLTKYLIIVDYKGDWMQEAKHAYRTKNFETYTPDDFPFFLEFNFNLTGIPDGRHSIVITAVGAGGYAERLTWYQFGINSSSSINFTIYTIPVVSFLSFENRTFKTSGIPLNFTVNQPVSKITYCLDGQENVTISGNTTLTGLPNGDHNVTVYATNEAGKTGASETITFTIAKTPELQSESFPTTIVIAPVASVAVVGAGLLLYFKKRRR